MGQREYNRTSFLLFLNKVQITASICISFKEEKKIVVHSTSLTILKLNKIVGSTLHQVKSHHYVNQTCLSMFSTLHLGVQITCLCCPSF
jgi:HJR/Mrr/RecB family endonuclease